MAKLGEICAFQSGGTPSKNKPEYFGGEIPWISTTALNGGKINEADAVAWITPKAIRESAAKIVPANSIMVGTRVGIGKVAINTVEMSTSQDVISLIGIDKDKWYKPYLCKLLLSKKDYFNSQARGATIKGIKIDVVANIDVPEIDYATQRKVAATLNKIDTLIVLRKQQLEKLDELIKARFVEMFGDPVANIANWPIERLEKHLTIIGGYAFKSDGFRAKGIPVLRIGNINSGYFQPTNMVYWHDDSTLERYKMHPGDLVISLTGTVGKNDYGNVCILGNDYSEYYLNQRNAKLELNETLNGIYLSELLKFPQIKGRLTGISRGIRQANISNKDILSLPILIPPISLQKQFAAFVERVERQKQTVQQSLEKLELMKKALMQEYFG